MISINISNVAKVNKANIELDGVTVIAGLNGTGKSTIAKCVFSSSNAQKDILKKIRNDKNIDIQRKISKWLMSDLVKIEKHEDGAIYEYEYELSDLILNKNDGKIEDDKQLFDNINNTIDDYCTENNIYIEDKGTLVDEIVSVVQRGIGQYIFFFAGNYYRNVFNGQINNFNTNNESQITFDRTVEESNFKSCLKFNNNEISYYKYNSISTPEKAVYIETHNVLDYCENYINRRTRRTLRTVPTNELIGYFRNERELSFSESKEVNLTKQIVSDIVDKITHGNIQQNKSGKMKFIEKDTQNEIEVSNMSSGLKIFTVIQSLLENYSLKRSDILIVDEPEVNLHPRWQVALAEIMVRLYKELGIYVLVNSHSPYFIRAIEVKMAEYGCANRANYYYMQEDNGGFKAEKVNDKMDIIYSALYEPLENL